MKQILLEVDDRTAAKLERVAPARSRRRSEFIREALRRALWQQEEDATREAYAKTSDGEDVYVEALAWEPRRRRARGKR